MKVWINDNGDIRYQPTTDKYQLIKGRKTGQTYWLDSVSVWHHIHKPRLFRWAWIARRIEERKRHKMRKANYRPLEKDYR